MASISKAVIEIDTTTKVNVQTTKSVEKIAEAIDVISVQILQEAKTKKWLSS